MPSAYEDIRVLQDAEQLADEAWQEIMNWDDFAREVVGSQFARSMDSVGANIAEALGRYHFGEKIQFLYYARGSIYETKYWLNRSRNRNLIPSERADQYTARISEITRQLNAFVASIKKQRQEYTQSKSTRESEPFYDIEVSESADFFTDIDLTTPETSVG